MLKWRTSVAASACACSAASGAVAAVVLVYRSLSREKNTGKLKKKKKALVLIFDLLNMLLTDMDVGGNSPPRGEQSGNPIGLKCNSS